MRLDRPRLARPALPSKMRLRLAGQDRRPLLADDSGAHWQESDEVEEDVDAPGVSPGGSGKWMSRSLTKSPRTPTLPAASVKKVKRALGASLPSRRGDDRAKSLKDLYDDDVESRDDESRCLLAGAYDEYYYLDQQGRTNFFAGASGDELSQESFGAPVVREPSEEEVRQLQLTPQAYRESPGASSLSGFKQLTKEESGALNVVDLGGFDSSSVGSASDKENAVAGGKDVAGSPKAGSPPLSRLSSLTSDLGGLQISQRSSLLAGSAHNSSVLGYSVDNSSSDVDLGTPTSQPRKVVEQKLYQTPEESVATKATYATSYTQPRQSPYPVAVTATDHGDVILMTPLEDEIDVGPQPETSEASGQRAMGAKQALMLPSLSPGTVQDGKAALESALKSTGKETPVKAAKRVGCLPQESPTGVEDVFSSDDEFSQVNFASKPPLSQTRDTNEFIASEDWSGSEDDENESLANSQAFGSVTVHQDAFRDLATERAQRSTIELRPSLESDCEASSSTVPEKSPAESVNRSLLDAAVLEEPEEPEEPEGSKETCLRLGSFSQIYSREGGEELLEEDSDDSESGCYFDLGHENIDDAEAPAAPRGTGQKAPIASQKSRPWAQVEDADDELSAGYVEADLVSASSHGSEDSLPTTPKHLLSSESSDSQPSGGERDTDESPNPTVDDFDNLNGYWLNAWSAMAAAEPEIETPEAKSLCDPDKDQPRFLLKKDVGNAMGDEDEPGEDAEENICTDCDGNQYLKIYDLDSGMDIYEVLQKSTELETVEECSSEEEEETIVNEREEKTEMEPAQPHVKEMDDLWSKIDEYQSTIGHGGTTQPRGVKSSKKRGVHVKKRAIAKSKSSAKAKFDLTALEKGSHHEEGTHQEKRSHSRTKSRESIEIPNTGSNLSQGPVNAALDDIVSEALSSLVRRESGIANPPDEEESATARRTSIKNADLSLLRLMKTEDLKLLTGGSDEGEGSAASSSLSVNSSGDEDSWNMEEGDDEKGKSGPSEQPVVATEPASQRPVVQRGASFTLTKLYSENVELAETLAATQSELEKVQRQLERVISERDDVISSARFEM